jgi:hypothetical protein
VKILLGVLLAALMAPVLIVLLENARGKRAWEEYLARAKAKGERVEVGELLQPPVPDEENFARIPLLRPLSDYHRKPRHGDEVFGRVVWHDPAGLERWERFRVFDGGTGASLGKAWRRGELEPIEKV